MWFNCATCADRITCAEEMGLVQSTCDDSSGTVGMCACNVDHRLDQDGVCVHKDSCTAPKVEYSPWSEWGACSVQCGGGGQATRSRICLGGATCVGPATETIEGVCGNQPCPQVQHCGDLSDDCQGFETGFENPITGEPVTIAMKVPIPDPDSPNYVPPPAGEAPPTPVITINGVDTTDYNPLTQEFSYPDPDTGTTRIMTIDPNNQG